jgi:hypothetical protein
VIGTHTTVRNQILVAKLEEREHMGDQGLDGMIIWLKEIFCGDTIK